MNLFMMGARHRTGRNPRPAIFRAGLRISRTCETNDMSISVPSTGVASTQRRESHADGVLANFHERVAQPKTWAVTEVSKVRFATLAMLSGRPEVETGLETVAVHGHFLDGAYVVVAMDVAQVGEIHRVFRRLLGMAGKAERPDLEAGPAGLVRRHRGQAPLRLPPPEPPPGEDQAENFPRLEDTQLRGLGWRGMGCGDAPGPVASNSKPWKGQTNRPSRRAPACRGPKVGPQVRANRFGNADAPVVVTPDDDVHAHPGFLDHLGPAFRMS